MSQQVTPEAFFDSLSLAHKLDNYLDGFKLEEIHLFSYFSSFLYCYSGNSVAAWQHRYIAANGFPFSNTINDAIKRHIQNGLFEDKGEYYSISGRGTDEFNKFKVLSTFTKRENLLNAACTTTILIPYAQTVRALLNEPDLKKQIALENNEWLDQTSFYPQFKDVSEALGIKSKDLVGPAVTWINFLNEISKLKE
tara:strand:+ start:289 stop:873 length:585 start_codon:yes stop_codon:yes gene_type:complete